MTSTASTGESAPWEDDEPLIQVFETSGFPPGHPAEPDLFIRQLAVPGHDQAAFERARVVMIGAGGLGSWTGLGLVRSGVRDLTIIDPDRFDRTNAHRQLMFPADLGAPKAAALARNLAAHMIGGGVIRAIGCEFEEALDQTPPTADILLVLVDSNCCRLATSLWARAHRVPVVFAMLSLDGMRLHVFLQGMKASDACLWCALPNLDPEAETPCAAATIASCFLAAAHTVSLTHQSLSIGLSQELPPFNWRDVDLLGRQPTLFGDIIQRRECQVCGTVPKAI